MTIVMILNQAHRTTQIQCHNKICFLLLNDNVMEEQHVSRLYENVLSGKQLLSGSEIAL